MPKPAIVKSKEEAEEELRSAEQISKMLIESKRESEARVAEAHREGNQIIYGGYRRYDT